MVTWSVDASLVGEVVQGFSDERIPKTLSPFTSWPQDTAIFSYQSEPSQAQDPLHRTIRTRRFRPHKHFDSFRQHGDSCRDEKPYSPGPGPISNLSTDFRVPSRKIWVAQSSQKIPFILFRPISSQHERRCARRSWYTIDAVMRTPRVPRPVSRNRNRLKIRTTRG